jgi:bifunctional non-homologous end joining protein LigD
VKYTPRLATLVKEAPSGDEWLHELKYDGYRIGCVIAGGNVQLLSRNGKDWTDRFAAVREAAAQLKVKRALLDGEVAVVLPDGRTSFQALQNALGGAAGQLVYFVFDLLHLDGTDIGRLPLEERKARLQKLLGKSKGMLRYSDHVVGHGDEVFNAACRQHAEGIVSKRRDRPFQAGRGLSWVKTKCIQRQEFIIGGYTDPEGARTGLGALLVGVREGDQLVYAGKVGTGFTQASLRDLRRRLEALAQRESPFSDPPPGKLGRTAHWVRPDLVGEVAFTEWTDDGSLRHPSFQGLRADKKPADVVRERPAATPDGRKPVVHEKRVTRGGGRRSVGASSATKRTSRTPPTQRSSTAPPPARAKGKGEVSVAGITLTHPDRVLYPDLGL